MFYEFALALFFIAFLTFISTGKKPAFFAFISKEKKPAQNDTIPKVAETSAQVLSAVEKNGNLIDYMQKCQNRLGDIFQIELSGTNHIVLCDVNSLKGLEVLGDRPIELLGPFTLILGKNSLEFVEEAEAMRRRGKYRSGYRITRLSTLGT